MENISEQITMNQIQNACQYPNLDTLRVFWKRVHPSVKFPKRHHQISIDLAREFLDVVATPGRGKDETVTNGASELLKSIGGSDVVTNDLLPRMKNPPPPPMKTGDPVSERKPIQKTKNSVHSISVKTEQNKPSMFDHWLSVFGILQKLNGFAWLTIIAVAVTTYGCWIYFDFIGLVISVFYAIILFEAIRAARKSNSISERSLALIAVVVLEALSGFIHFGWLNIHLWEKVGKLPFKWTSTERIKVGSEWTNQISNATPGTIAVVFALFISAASFYAVMQQMNRTSDSMWD